MGRLEPGERGGDSFFIARLVRQDRAAWDEAYSRYAPRVLALIRSAVHSNNWFPLQGQEEDLLVATFFRAFQHIRELREREAAPLLAWLRKIAVSLCISEVRKIHLETVLEDLEGPGSEESLETLVLSCVSP